MTDDLERTLNDAPRSRVPESLDRGVESLVLQAQRRAIPAPRWNVPLWATAAFCAIFALLGFLAGAFLWGERPATGREPAVVYVEEFPGELPVALRAAKGEMKTGFFERKRGEVQVIIGR